MTRFFTFALTGLLLAAPAFVACKRAEVAPSAGSLEANTQLLTGRWQLRQTVGGIAGQTVPADPAQKEEIVFQPGGTAVFLINGTASGTASYSLSQRTAFTTGQSQTFVIYTTPAQTESQYIERISPTELVLAHDANDGFRTYYTRSTN